MRFLPGGPAIPDDLLIARDRGEVAFFCGAGVSQAKASLDNFLQLAKNVIRKLGAAADSPARKLLDAALNSSHIEGVGGFVATDRIFSLLEREFEVSDIHRAVAQALRPMVDPDLSAHRTVLDLACVVPGEYRLVTTNFDLLFEACDRALPSIGPLALPDLRRTDFRGIVHLHGRVDADYTRSDDHGFVLSSSDFGRAYLADGWAAGFIRSLIERYYVVFLGYSADDPPVQYLLEALGSTTRTGRRMFAFQSGESSTAAALWSQKGVRAIPYDASDSRHATLWSTLEAWAARARDPDAWHAAVLDSTRLGPEKLEPHVRGQVTHLFSTEDGLQRVLTSPEPVPASWLRTLDPRSRYRSPPARLPDEETPPPDPFDQYSIDEDVVPEPHDPDQMYREREMPTEAWDAFKPSKLDTPVDGKSSGISLLSSDGSPALPRRLHLLAGWLGQVLHQRSALTWAIEQRNVHPLLRQKIKSTLDHEQARFDNQVARGWSILLRAWEDSRGDPDSVGFAVSREVNETGWSEELVRRLSAARRPKLRMENVHDLGEDVEPNGRLYRVTIDYPRPHHSPSVPDNFLSYAVAEARKNLELAASYLREFQDDYLYIKTTRADDDVPALSDDAYGIAGPLIYMQNLMDRLCQFDPEAAHAEFLAWPLRDNGIFTRLRIWALSKPLVTSREEAARIVSSLSDKSFWGDRHRRDLMYSIRDRWTDLPLTARLEIEHRILRTGFPWSAEQKSKAAPHDARQKHALIAWLAENGVEFSFDIQAALEKLAATSENQLIPPTAAIESNELEVFTITTDKDPAGLLDIPLKEIFNASPDPDVIDFSARRQFDPFAGLVEAHPLRALSALGVAARAGMTTSVPWRTFLRVEGRKADRPRIIKLVAGRLLQMKDDQLAEIVYHGTDWFKRLAPRIYRDLPDLFDPLWAKLLSILEYDVPDLPNGSTRNWADEALNSAAGHMAQTLLDPCFMYGERPLPDDWKRRFEGLLSLSGDLRPQVIALAAFHLINLFDRDRSWTERALLPFHGGADDAADAFWDGFLWRNHAPQDDLMVILKPSMLALARQQSQRRRNRTGLVEMLVYFWFRGTREPKTIVASEELREVLIHGGSELAGTTLWSLKHTSIRPNPTPNELATFFEDVWPRQKALRNAPISRGLVAFALSSGEALPVITPILVHRLVQTDEIDVSPFRYAAGADLVERFPRHVLDLLVASLRPEAAAGQYGLDEILDRLAKAPETADDQRLLTLRRRSLRS